MNPSLLLSSEVAKFAWGLPGGLLFLHGFQRGVIQPLIEGGFGEPPDLPDLDGRDLTSAGLAVDGVRHDAQVPCHFTDIHDPCHSTHPLTQQLSL